MESIIFRKFDPVTDDWHLIPECAGNYIVALKPGKSLPKCDIPYVLHKYNGLDVIYTGIARRNLRQRDYRSHFSGTAGRSTLRKSLGCFWNYPFVPRDKNQPNNGKVKYSNENEDRISLWMRDNLVLLFCVNNDCESLECELIERFNPPLNLMGNYNPANAEFRDWLSSRRSRGCGL